MNHWQPWSDPMPPLLLLGASSPVGRALTDALLDAGHSLMAVSRRVPNSSRAGLVWMQQDLYSEPVRTHAHHLISAGPLPLVVKQARAVPGLKRIIAFSSASVLFKQDSPDRSERELIHCLLKAETQLRELSNKRSIDLTLLRPTLIYGGVGDRSLSIIREQIEARRWIPLAGNGLRQPVHVEDLANLVVELVQRTGHGVECFVLGGGETLPYRTMIERIAAQQQRSIRLLRVPSWVMTTALRLIQPFGHLKHVTQAMIHRQAIDLAVDDRDARTALNWHPRPFRPSFPAD
ncbi:MAG: hypothetical protein AAGH65_07950 [Pseudomonadota bacterium]